MIDQKEIVAEVEAPETDVAAVETEAADAPEQEEAQDLDADAQDDTPFPKKAVNAISRHKKNANKFKAERDALAKEIEALRKAQEVGKSAQPASEPKLEDFQTVQEYLKAMAIHTAKHTLTEDRMQQGQERLSALELQHKELYREERAEYIGNKAVELFEKVPEAKELFAQVMPILEQMPPEIQEIAEALDNAPLAIYNLYKEGALERLAYMPPHLAAVALYNAQMKEVAAPQVTSAPKPISAAKGSRAVSKTLNTMKPDELVDWVRS